MNQYYKIQPVEGAWEIHELDESKKSLLDDLPNDQMVAETWEPLQMAGLWADMGRRRHRTDMPYYGELVFPDTALEAACSILEKDGEFLRMDVRHEGTYWYYHCTTVIDALDVEHSQVKRFSDGEIMWVEAYALHDDMIEGHTAFQVPEAPFTLYTQPAVDRLLALNLTGLAFEPIPMA